MLNEDLLINLTDYLYNIFYYHFPFKRINIKNNSNVYFIDEDTQGKIISIDEFNYETEHELDYLSNLKEKNKIIINIFSLGYGFRIPCIKILNMKRSIKDYLEGIKILRLKEREITEEGYEIIKNHPEIERYKFKKTYGTGDLKKKLKILIENQLK